MCQAQGRIRFGAEWRGNKVVWAGRQRADRITLTENSNRIDLMELLAERMCLKFCYLQKTFNYRSSQHSVHLNWQVECLTWTSCAKWGQKQPDWCCGGRQEESWWAFLEFDLVWGRNYFTPAALVVVGYTVFLGWEVLLVLSSLAAFGSQI